LSIFDIYEHQETAASYAALWKSSMWRIQKASGFHLGKIWSTTFTSNVLSEG
jgi:hypothetical protein